MLCFYLYVLGIQLWPIQFCISNLPPHLRGNVQNLIVAGLWLGCVKPNLNSILQLVLNKLKYHKENGINIQTKDGAKIVRAMLIQGIFDFIAKAMALNHVQFNGYYGCPYCMDRGTYCNHRTIWLPSDEHEQRTLANLVEFVRQAESTHKSVYGIKGRSILSEHMNIILSVVIDYLHSILEGITKAFMEFWFDSKYSSNPFSIRKFLKEIDKKLSRIRPPHNFRSSPRSISSFWKASELKAWLLFYSVPILKDILPPKYINHWILLVCAMHILLSTSISQEDLVFANENLIQFYELAPILYPNNVCTANLHSIVHVCKFVENWGPLWCYSTFCFENLNGFLKRQCHGTGNVLPQIHRSLKIRQEVSKEYNTISECKNDSVVKYFSKYDISFMSHLSKCIKSKYECLTEDEKATLNSIGVTINEPILTKKQLQLKVNVVHCRSDKHKRNSSVCEVKYMTNVQNTTPAEICVISVRRFVQLEHNGMQLAMFLKKLMTVLLCMKKEWIY